MLHPDDQSQTVTVHPPLSPREVDLVAGLAGVGRVVRRVWPGQPGRRSPWLPCAAGCCLVAEQRPGADPVTWLRFLVRELIDPHAAEPRARARRLGLPGGHRLEGEVLLPGGRRSRLLVVTGRRVRVVELGDDLRPLSWSVRPGRVRPARVRPGPVRGEVVDLVDRPDK